MACDIACLGVWTGAIGTVAMTGFLGWATFLLVRATDRLATVAKTDLERAGPVLEIRFASADEQVVLKEGKRRFDVMPVLITVANCGRLPARIRDIGFGYRDDKGKVEGRIVDFHEDITVPLGPEDLRGFRGMVFLRPGEQERIRAAERRFVQVQSTGGATAERDLDYFEKRGTEPVD